MFNVSLSMESQNVTYEGELYIRIDRKMKVYATFV